jgi:hypothetical protein
MKPVTNPGKIFRGLLFLTFVLSSLAAQADGEDESDLHPMMNSDFWVLLGAYTPDHTVSVSLDGNFVPDLPEIDFGGEIGLGEKTTLFSGEFGWQFSENWSFSAQRFTTERNQSATIDETIEWGELVFDVGAEIEAGTSSAITRLFFARKFLDSGPHDLRLGAGLHWLEIEAYLQGIASVNGEASQFQSRVASFKAPLPNVGAWYRYSLSERWLFSFRADWLAASIGDLSGRIINLTGGVNFALFEHFGVGVSYQYFRLDVDVSSDSWKGHADLIYDGPYLYLSGNW